MFSSGNCYRKQQENVEGYKWPCSMTMCLLWPRWTSRCWNYWESCWPAHGWANSTTTGTVKSSYWWHCHCEECHFCVDGLFFKTCRNPNDSYRLFRRKSCTTSRYYIGISAKSTADDELVKKMMTASLVTIVQVLERQYSRYFNLDATALYFRGVRLLQRVLPSAMTVVHYLQSLVKFLQFLANYPHDLYRVIGGGVRDSQRLPLEGAIQRHIGLL